MHRRPRPANRLRLRKPPCAVTRSAVASLPRNRTTPTFGPSISIGPWRNCPPSSEKQGCGRVRSGRARSLRRHPAGGGRRSRQPIRPTRRQAQHRHRLAAGIQNGKRSAGSSPRAQRMARCRAKLTVRLRVAAKACSVPPAPTSDGTVRAREEPPSSVRPKVSARRQPRRTSATLRRFRRTVR